MKKFKDGTWYTKTETDFLNAAVSVAHNNSDGREFNIIDTESGRIIEHRDEEADMKKYMTSKEGYDAKHPFG